MNETVEDRTRKVVAAIESSATETQRLAIAAWAADLLAIRNDSALTAVEKARRAVRLTAGASVVSPMAVILSREVRRLGWDDRSWAGRLGLAGAGLGLALFGGQGAGIAALGTAIGVPLWIVLGSGGAFAGVLIEELSKERR